MDALTAARKQTAHIIRIENRSVLIMLAMPWLVLARSKLKTLCMIKFFFRFSQLWLNLNFNMALIVSLFIFVFMIEI
jgi:hypothetical protein